MEYHKIQTLFLRDPDNNHKTLLEGQYAKPEFEYLKDNHWIFTEKVDGTNIRIYWDNEFSHKDVIIQGKTKRAEIPPFLLKKLEELFPIEKFQKNEYPPMCLYGEGYGAKIQKGGRGYIPDGVDFILFDVQIDGIWLERHNVEDIAEKLNIKVAPIVAEGSLDSMVEMCKYGFMSELRETPPEGLVARPKVEMSNRRGERIITKLKMNDFKLDKKE